MAFSMLCPRCKRQYDLRPEMFGKEVTCACGQVFVAPVPPARPSPGPLASSSSNPLEDLLAQSLGPSTSAAPLASGGLAGSGPLGASLTSYRRHRLSANEITFLAAGAGMAAFGFGCLAALYRLLGLTAMGWMVAAILLMLSGAALLVFSQRRNLLVALPVGTAIVCLAVVGFMIRPLPKTPEQVVDECLRASQEFVAAMESIRDEETLRQARPKALDALAKMIRCLEQGKRLASQGHQASPETERKMEAAMAEFNARCAGLGRRLSEIPGGPDLLREIAQTFKGAQDRMASIPNPPPTPGVSRPEPLLPERRNELKALGVAYHAYCDQHQGAAPPNWESFEQFLQNNPATLAVLRKLRAEGWVVHWGVGFAQCTVGTSNFILAHGKDAPEKGGPILYMDGACTSLPAEEIRQHLTAQAPLEPPGQRLTFAPPTQIAGTPPAGINSSPQVGSLPPAPPPDDLPIEVDEPPPNAAKSGGSSTAPARPATPGATPTPNQVPPPSSMPKFAPPAPPDSVSPPAPGMVPPRMPGMPGVPMPGAPRSGAPMPGAPVPGMAGPMPEIGRRSETVGGTGGILFLKARSNKAVVGLSWRAGNWAGRSAIGQLDPKFDGDSSSTMNPAMPGGGSSNQSVFAKSGYAVGGLVVDADQFVNAVQPIFMKLRTDGTLDPSDRYEGPWLGQPSGKPTRTIDGRGVKVIGVHGRGAAVLDAVGLVFEQ